MSFPPTSLPSVFSFIFLQILLSICWTNQILWSYSDAQLEHNSKNRRPSLSPVVLRQQEQEQRAKMAANAPVDITQVMSKLSKQRTQAPPAPPAAGS